MKKNFDEKLLSQNTAETTENKVKEAYYIISNKENEIKIPSILQKYPNSIILKTEEIACQLKYKEENSYILLSQECPLHPFKNKKLNCETSLKEILNENYEIENDKLIFEKKIFKNLENLNKNAYKYFYYHFDNLPKNLNEKYSLKDKTTFLISRLAKIEKAKEKKVFGIFFTAPFYEKIVDRLVLFLKSVNKNVYKFFIKDVTETRLNCFDGIECIILVDCPFRIKFIDFHIPLLVPFEIQMAFGNWTGDYSINTFDLKPLENKEMALAKIDYSTGKLVKMNEVQAVQFDLEGLDDNRDVDIEEGHVGIAGAYENEKKYKNDKNKRFLIYLDESETAEIEMNAVLRNSNIFYKKQKIEDRYFILQCDVSLIDILALRCFCVIKIEVILDEKEIKFKKLKFEKFMKKFQQNCEKNDIPSNEDNMHKFDIERNFFCKCYWKKIEKDEKIFEKTQKNYFKESKVLKEYKGTKILQNFLVENKQMFMNENENVCVSEGLKFHIPYVKKIKEENLFEKYEFLLNHSPKKLNPDRLFNIYLTFDLITTTFRITNRKFFFKHEIKKQSFIGKTSMPVRNCVLAINLLNLKNNVIYDPCCGAGSLLFIASLFGNLVCGTELHRKQLVGFNETTTKVRTSLKGYDINTNFKQFSTSDKILFFGLKDIFSMNIDLSYEYILTDLPYGVRSMKTTEIDEYIKILKKMYDKKNVKGICFWMEGGYQIENIFGDTKYKITEKLKTCERILYVFAK